jgi:hypothetical protein
MTEIFENNQKAPEICDFSGFNYNIFKSKYSEVQRPMLNPPASFENISKVFTLDTEKENPCLSSKFFKFFNH